MSILISYPDKIQILEIKARPSWCVSALSALVRVFTKAVNLSGMA
jgi:hypothetical protein